MLEWIPLSRNNDVKRFIEFFDKLIKEKEITEHLKMYKQTKDKVRRITLEISKEEADKQISDLTNIIKNKMKDRQGGILSSLMAKYGETGPKSIKSAPKEKSKNREQTVKSSSEKATKKSINNKKVKTVKKKE